MKKFFLFYFQGSLFFILYDKFITSCTSMFKWATFREILLPSSGNVNDYVAHI